MRTLIAIAVVTMAMLGAANAHDHARPELDEWFRGLTNEIGGSCCDGSDAFSVLDPEWDVTTDPNFRSRSNSPASGSRCPRRPS
jgi:hypothetical protein